MAEPMRVNLLLEIINGSTVLVPLVEGTVKLKQYRKGNPETLTFNVVKDDAMAKSGGFQEGNVVRLTVDGKKVFYGFIFKKTRTKTGIISCTAYSQQRYLKNKDSMIYKNLTAGQLVKKICGDYTLKAGSIADTGYSMSRVEDECTLFDTIQNALDETLMNTGNLYVLYDDFGSLALKKPTDMKVDIVIDGGDCEDFYYTSSIDSETYNQVKLTYDDDKTGKRKIYIAKDGKRRNEWGVLQYSEKIDDSVKSPQTRANGLLKLYDKKTRNLKVKGVFGDVRIRGGSLPVVSLNLGDISVGSRMRVEEVEHNFEAYKYTMDVTLVGNDSFVK